MLQRSEREGFNKTKLFFLSKNIQLKKRKSMETKNFYSRFSKIIILNNNTLQIKVYYKIRNIIFTVHTLNKKKKIRFLIF